MSDSAEGLTVVLPVFDQEAGLGKVIDAWVTALNTLNRPYEILIVDDGSRDGTRALADAVATRNARVKVLSHPERAGYGACLRTAVAAAAQPLLFYTSSEPGWHTSDLATMLKRLDQTDPYTGKSVEIVNGHRRGIALPPNRRRLNQTWRVFARIVFGFWPERPRGWLGRDADRFGWRCRLQFGLRIGDITSKFKLIRRSVFDRFEIQSDGEFVHAEILAKANFLGCLMDEVPLTDKQVPSRLPDMSTERRRVFRSPKFRSPVANEPSGDPTTIALASGDA